MKRLTRRQFGKTLSAGTGAPRAAKMFCGTHRFWFGILNLEFWMEPTRRCSVAWFVGIPPVLPGDTYSSRLTG